MNVSHYHASCHMSQQSLVARPSVSHGGAVMHSATANVRDYQYESHLGTNVGCVTRVNQSGTHRWVGHGTATLYVVCVQREREEERERERERTREKTR